MSSTSRANPRGGKGAAKAIENSGSKTQKSDTKTDTQKGSDLNPKTQPTAEQMRIAQIIETKTDDPDMKNKIKQIMEATRKSEDEVCTALHDCDNDLDRAVNMLLEGQGQGEWVTSGNKKKNRHPTAAASTASARNEKSDNNRDRSEPGESGGPDRERSRTRGGGPPRMRGRGSSDSRGWRGRENKENEKNLQEEVGRDGGGAPRRGGGSRMMNGPGRSGRGGRGGRSGPRTFQSRDKGPPGFPRAIETWNPQGESEPADAPTNGAGGDKWGEFPSPDDWDNEEYSGSLADTKVFTPSVTSQMVAPSGPTDSAPADLATAASALPTSSSLDTAASMLPTSLTAPGLSQGGGPGSKTLSAAQTQYFASLGAENLKAPPANKDSYMSSSGGYNNAAATTYQTSAYTATTVSYSSTAYGSPAVSSVAPSYSSQIKGTATSMTQQQATQQQQQQQTQARPKNQRVRVPPPSKIPSSAVEMPGDTASSGMGVIDVQFGVDFTSDSSTFDFTPSNTAQAEVSAAAKYQAQSVDSSKSGVPLDLSGMSLANKNPPPSQQSAQVMEGYPASTVTSQHAKDISQQQATTISAMNQKLTGSENMTFPSSQVAEHKAASYSQGRQSNTSSTGGLDMVKPEPTSATSLSYSSNSSNNAPSYQTSYQKPSSNVYQSSTNYSSGSTGGGGSSAYSQGSQYQTSSNQQSQNSGYSSSQTGYNTSNQVTTTTAFPSTQTPTTTYSQTSSSYHQTPSNYQGSYQPTSASSYQTNQQYQTGSQQQSYTATGGSTSYTPVTGSSAASQYQNSYGSNGPVTTATALHGAATSGSTSSKLGTGMGGSTTSKDSQYDAPSTAGTSSSLGQGASSVTPSSLGLTSSAGQTTSNSASTKVTTSSNAVPPMLNQHQYILGQQGMPFYNVQQPIYGFEDYQHQLMQSRVPMQTASGFYDMSTIAAGRDSGMTSVAYSVSDGRFARTDNNSSPVPSTLSQQNPTQAHQQPMLNPTTLPPGYAYFYGAGVVPGSFQYGTPALYQLPTATNAHGATNSTQYPKPATYSSAYGSGYDSLSSQGAADYSKASGGYVSGNSQAGQSTKGSVVGGAGSTTSGAAAASDLTSNMYSKTHVALGKVNSYDKQGFHSGTPPPFSLPASQTSQMGAAAGYTPLFIPTLAPHQQLHQPMHQMEFRSQGRRSDSGSGTGQRSQQTSQQNKTGVKQAYNTSYWAQN